MPYGHRHLVDDMLSLNAHALGKIKTAIPNPDHQGTRHVRLLASLREGQPSLKTLNYKHLEVILLPPMLILLPSLATSYHQ